MAVGPDVPLPGVQAPSTPSVPSVPPVPNVPTVPRVPTVPSAPKLPSAPPVGPPVDLPPAPASPAPPALTGTSGASGASVRVTVGSTTALAGVGGAAERRAGARRRPVAGQRARERSFRRDVRRHAPCFYVLSGFKRHVLALRAGLRGAQPRSRVYVARRLKTSARSIVRAERLALKSLRNADDSDGCAMASGRVATGIELAVRMLTGATFSPALVFLADGASDQLLASANASPGDRGDAAGVKTSSDSKGEGKADDRDSAGITLPSSGTADAPGDGLNGALIAALFAVAALLMAATTLGSRGRRRAHGQGDRWSEGPATPAPWTQPEQTPTPTPTKGAGSEQKAAPRETHGSPAARKGHDQKRIRTRNRR